MNTGSFYDTYYIPPPVIDPYLVDLTLLGSHVSPLDDEAVDEEGPVARFEWVVLDEDEPPVKIMRFKPAEHVSIPLVHRIHSASIHLLGFDPSPAPLDGYVWAIVLLMTCLLFAEAIYWRYLRERGRDGEYLRLMDYARDWLKRLDRFMGTVVIPPQEEYYL